MLLAFAEKSQMNLLLQVLPAFPDNGAQTSAVFL